MRHNHFSEFIEEAEQFIEINPLLYYFLDKTISRVLEGSCKIHDCFFINGTSSRICVLFTTEVCLIYDNGFDRELIPILAEELKFEKFNQYQFSGSKHTIEALFISRNANYDLQKHRVIYRCDSVSGAFVYSPGALQMGNMDRLSELCTLSAAFTEEYDGTIADEQTVLRRVMQGIYHDTIYQWVDNGIINSIAQRLDDYNFPVIGHLYTNTACRNSGYGASLVHALTKGLLGVPNDFVMLSTNALTPASNRVFEKVGYRNVGEYWLAYKKRI